MTTYTINGEDYTTDDVVAELEAEQEIEGVTIRHYNLGVKNPDYDQQSPASKYYIESLAKPGCTRSSLTQRKASLQSQINLCDLYIDKIDEVEAE